MVFLITDISSVKNNTLASLFGSIFNRIFNRNKLFPHFKTRFIATPFMSFTLFIISTVFTHCTRAIAARSCKYTKVNEIEPSGRHISLIQIQRLKNSDVRNIWVSALKLTYVLHKFVYFWKWLSDMHIFIISYIHFLLKFGNVVSYINSGYYFVGDFKSSINTVA